MRYSFFSILYIVIYCRSAWDYVIILCYIDNGRIGGDVEKKTNLLPMEAFAMCMLLALLTFLWNPAKKLRQ